VLIWSISRKVITYIDPLNCQTESSISMVGIDAFCFYAY